MCRLWRHASAANQSIKGPSTPQPSSLSAAPLPSLSARKVLQVVGVAPFAAFLIYFGSFLRFMHCAFPDTPRPRPTYHFSRWFYFSPVSYQKPRTPNPSSISLRCCPLNLIPTYLANKINLPQLVWPSSYTRSKGGRERERWWEGAWKRQQGGGGKETHNNTLIAICLNVRHANV